MDPPPVYENHPQTRTITWPTRNLFRIEFGGPLNTCPDLWMLNKNYLVKYTTIRYWVEVVFTYWKAVAS